MNCIRDMKRWLCAVLVALAITVSLPAVADGGKRDVSGTRWVDPVEYLELKQAFSKLETSTKIVDGFEKKGTLDIQQIIREKGVKVLGLKLKPYTAAAHWLGFSTFADYSFKNKWGVAISGESFCIYPDEGVSRNYEVDYTFEKSKSGFVGTYNLNIHGSLKLTDLRVVPTEQGVAFSYALDCTYKATGAYHGILGETENLSFNKKSNKPASTTDELAFFHYWSKDGLLLLAVGGKETEEKYKNEEFWVEWPHVFYIVEEILVEDNSGVLSLIGIMNGLLQWLTGESDPFGLGEHTGPLEAAVVSVIGIIASILLSNIGAAATTPPYVPDIPHVEATIPKRKEEEEKETSLNDSESNGLPEEDFSSINIRQQPDGDVVMWSPVTGKDVHFYANGDGTWFSDSGQTYTAADIEERYRYESENVGVLRQDAETAARNLAEQRAAWDAQNQRDRERGYSDEQKAYQDWKKAQEDALNKELFMDHMMLKYNAFKPTEESLKEAMKFKQILNEIDQQAEESRVAVYDDKIGYLQKIDKKSEFAINIMAGILPEGTGAPMAKNVYTFTKSTLVAASEAYAEGKTGMEAAGHIIVGMGNGALGVLQNEASNIAKTNGTGLLGEYVVTIGTEGVKEGASTLYKEGMKEGGITLNTIVKANNAIFNSVVKKSTEFGMTKSVNAVFKTLKEGSADYVDYANKGMFPDSDSAHKMMSNLNKFLNNEGQIGALGEVSTGGQVAEVLVIETLNYNDVYSPVGNAAETMTNESIQIIADFNEKAEYFRRRRLGS